MHGFVIKKESGFHMKFSFSKTINYDASNKIGHHCRYVLIIIAVTFLPYFNSLGNGFVADDNEFVKYNKNIKSLENVASFFNSSDTIASTVPEWGTHIYRPLRTLSYAIDYSVYQLNSTGYHVTNLLLHMLVCVALYYFISCLFQQPTIALLGAVIFALHPVHVEAVSWIASRADLIGTLFFILSILSYVYYQHNSTKKLFLFFALVFSFLAYLGKESMIVLPIIIVVYDLISHRDTAFKRICSLNAIQWTFFILIAIGYLLLRFNVTGRMDQAMNWWGGSITSNFLMTMKAIATYILLLFLPYQLKTHYIIEPVTSFLNVWVILSCIVIIISFVTIGYFYKKNKLIFFSLIWFYIGLLPVANLIPTTFSVMGERFMYMPSIGPIIAITYGLYTLSQKSNVKTRILCSVLIILLIAFSVRIVIRNQVYADELAFYSSAIKSSPNSAPSYKGLADYYLKNEDYQNAIIHYEKAIKIDAGFAEAFMGNALSLNKINNNNEAILKAEKAVQLKPDKASIRFNMGMIYKNTGDIVKAVSQWEETVKLNPNHSVAYNNLGNYNFMMKDYTKAIAIYNESLRLDPNNVEANYNIAMTYELQGNYSEARHYFMLFVKLAGQDYGDTVEAVKKKYR